jgi:hypothetical protein
MDIRKGFFFTFVKKYFISSTDNVIRQKIIAFVKILYVKYIQTKQLNHMLYNMLIERFFEMRAIHYKFRF